MTRNTNKAINSEQNRIHGASPKLIFPIPPLAVQQPPPDAFPPAASQPPNVITSAALAPPAVDPGSELTSTIASAPTAGCALAVPPDPTSPTSSRQPLADRGPLRSDPFHGESLPCDYNDFDLDTAYLCLASVRDQLHELVDYPPPRNPEFALSRQRDIRQLRTEEILLAARIATLRASPPSAADDTMVVAAPPIPLPDPSSLLPDQSRAVAHRKRRRPRRK